MLAHLNEQQNCTTFKKGLQRNYCLSGYQVSLRDICKQRRRDGIQNTPLCVKKLIVYQKKLLCGQ